MLIRIHQPQPNTFEVKWVTRFQLEEEFRLNPALEKVDVLKISRTITRRKILG